MSEQRFPHILALYARHSPMYYILKFLFYSFKLFFFRFGYIFINPSKCKYIQQTTEILLQHTNNRSTNKIK